MYRYDEFQSLEISLDRIDNEGYSLISGVIGKNVHELYYDSAYIRLTEISEIIGAVFVKELHVQGMLDDKEM